MANELDLIPRVTIHPDKICLYKEVHWVPVKTSAKFNISESEITESNNESFINSARRNNGFLSIHAKRKIFKAIDYLLITSDKRKIYSKVQKKYISFRIVFVTLTLPSKQLHSDKEINNLCLNQLFVELTKYHHVKKFVWRAEKQENGNIHYHILINEFVEWSELRKRWNRICNKLGYVDRYQKKMKEFYKNGFRLSDNPKDKRSEKQQREAFILGQKSDWTSPNSTDIHDTRNVKDIKRYVGKYMTKKIDIEDLKKSDNKLINIEALKDYDSIDFEAFEKDERIDLQAIIDELEKMTVKARLWSCSQNLSNVKGCQLIEDWEISDELETISNNSKCKTFHDPYFKIMFIDSKRLVEFGSEKLFNYFARYLLETFDYNLQLKLAT